MLSKGQKLKLYHIKKSDNQSFVIHDLRSLILSFYSSNLISHTEGNINRLLNDFKIKSPEDFETGKNEIANKTDIFKIVTYTEGFIEKDKQFQDYLYNRILNSHLAQTMDGKASYILRNLIQAYLSNPKQLQDGTVKTLMQNYLSEKEYSKLINNKSNKFAICIMRDNISELHNISDNNFKTALIRTITDFIAGMTDKFALSQYRMLYGSENYWLK